MKFIDGKRAREVLSEGISDLSRLVGVTYGPRGATVAVRKGSEVLITTDGSSLARETRFGGLGRLGASMVLSAAAKADENSGDGTSTAILLTNAILEEALGGYAPRTWDPVSLVRDLRELLPAVEASLRGFAREADEGLLRRVALMASHGDDVVSDRVIEAVTRVGETGTVLLSAGDGVGIEVDYREGLVLDVGWAAHEMGRGGSAPREMDGPLVAVVASPLAAFEDVRSLMEESSQWPGRGLVLFCPRVTGDALTTMLMNDNRGVLSSVAVVYAGPPDSLGEWLGDVAAVTGANVVDPSRGDSIREFRSEWLGSARKITVEKSRTEILSYPDVSDRIGERVGELLLRAETASHDYDRDSLRERAAAMDGGLATLKIGGYTETEARERRSRAEDALHSVRRALSDGLLPGAGRALQFVGGFSELRETVGGRVLARALEEPARVLASRAGAVYGTASEGLGDDPWTGFDPVLGVVRDFGTDPAIVDAAGVVAESLRVAVSVASEILLTELVLACPKDRSRNRRAIGPRI